jgi:hypothetical protein
MATTVSMDISIGKEESVGGCAVAAAIEFVLIEWRAECSCAE